MISRREFLVTTALGATLGVTGLNAQKTDSRHVCYVVYKGDYIGAIVGYNPNEAWKIALKQFPDFHFLSHCCPLDSQNNKDNGQKGEEIFYNLWTEDGSEFFGSVLTSKGFVPALRHALKTWPDRQFVFADWDQMNPCKKLSWGDIS